MREGLLLTDDQMREVRVWCLKLERERIVLSVDGWVSSPAVTAPTKPENPQLKVVADPMGATAPQLGVPRPAVALPLREGAPGLWILGVHGGAGETTLAAQLGAWEAGHAWPVSPSGPSRVILVARSDGRGVRAAQQAVQQWASGMVPRVEVAGILWSADAPGKIPRSLKDRIRVISGGVPRSWEMPWIEAWRSGASLPNEQLPNAAQKTLKAIFSLCQEEKSNDPT